MSEHSGAGQGYMNRNIVSKYEAHRTPMTREESKKFGEDFAIRTGPDQIGLLTKTLKNSDPREVEGILAGFAEENARVEMSFRPEQIAAIYPANLGRFQQAQEEAVTVRREANKALNERSIAYVDVMLDPTVIKAGEFRILNPDEMPKLDPPQECPNADLWHKCLLKAAKRIPVPNNMTLSQGDMHARLLKVHAQELYVFAEQNIKLREGLMGIITGDIVTQVPVTNPDQR